MNRKFTRRSVLQAAGALSGLSALGSHAAAAKRPSRYVIGTASPAAEQASRSRADNVYRELDFGSIGRAIAGRFSPEAREALRNRPDVRYVEPDGQVEALAQELPWGIDRVDADVAHANGEAGAGADIAIIDTGIDSDHPDLQANLGDGYAVVSCESSDCNAAWDDDNDHGTHCAGIAAAVDNAEGVVGVAPGATLHAVKVLDSTGSGTFSGVADGVKWVADQGYDVGSLSLGGSSGSQTIKDACQYAYDLGVVLVAATGNDGCTDCVSYPAAYDTVVAVSATHETDDIAVYSSTGPEVDLTAPGSEIYSTVVDGYATFSGTSMACPHVSAAAGMLMVTGLTPTEARTRLYSTAEDLGHSSSEQGHGLLDVPVALELDGGSAVVSTEPATDVGDTTATLHGSVDDLGGADSADVYFKYREYQTTTWTTTSSEPVSSTGSFSQTVSGFAADTYYEFCAVAVTAGVAEGDSLLFQTAPADPNVSVSTVDATGLGETSATLTGDLTAMGDASSVDVSFEYRERGTDLWSASTVVNLTSTGTFSDDVSELSPGTEYEFRALAVASDGGSDTGSSVSFVTLSDTSVAVSTSSPTNVGETTATLRGSLDSLGGAATADVSFVWGPAGETLSETTAVRSLSTTGAFEETISGLSSGTEYAFSAVATASDGDTDSGDTVTFMTVTGSAAPTVDSYVVSEAGSPNPHAEITAEWSTSDSNGDLTTVSVDILDTAGTLVDTTSTTVTGDAAAGTDSFKIKNVGRTTFDVRVTVTDTAGHSTTQSKRVTS